MKVGATQKTAFLVLLELHMRLMFWPSPSNDVAMVTGTLTNVGTLTVTNVGATPLVAGNRFTLFDQPLANGNALAILSDDGVVWSNKLE